MPRKISPCWKITWVGVGRGAREVATDNWSNWKSFQLLNFILLMSENQKNILLVEDEPLLANLLKQRLEKENFIVNLAQDGEEALKFLKNQKPDLILLDIILPKISGFELMEKLKSAPEIQKAPIIIISNLGQEKDVTKGYSLGAIEYFIKAQVSIEELVSQIKSFLIKK